jgi:hypothetical protein
MTRARTWLALVVLALSGCGTFLDLPPANSCESDSECRSGRCDLARGMCVTEPTHTMRVGLTVTPASDPYGNRPLPVSFAPMQIEGPSETTLVVPLGVAVRGLVRSGGEPVSASIVFTLLSEIPGGPTTSIEAQTLGQPISEGGVTFNYSAHLLPGRVYDVAVEPNAEWRAQLPPLRFRFESPPEGTQSVQNFEYPEELATVRGILADADGNEQSNMLVRAVEPTSGRVISSTFMTGSEGAPGPGHFEIRLAPGTESWFFSINASTERIQEGHLAPTFLVDPSGLIEEDGVVRILMPSDIGERSFRYAGTVESVPTQGIEGATLTFVALDVVDDVTGVIGTFRNMATTNDCEDPKTCGRFQIDLLPGTYEVVVTPGSEYGVLREMLRIDDVDGDGQVQGQSFQVPTRAPYAGSVRTQLGEPMFDALVRGQARGSTFGGTLSDVAVFARSNESYTDANGYFNLPLDVGLYDVVVEPPAGTNWPWALGLDRAIGGSAAPIDDVFELGTPVPLTGRAVYESGTGAPLGNAVVNAYAIIETSTGDTRTVQIGRATTDMDGQFTLLLPPSL